MSHVLAYVAIASGIVTMLGGGGLLGWWRYTKPDRERNRAANEVILGEAPVMDRNNKVITPGRDGLTDRVSTVENAVVEISGLSKELRHLVGLWGETQKRLEVHDAAINALIAGSLERAATAMSSAALLNAVAERDTTNGDADETSGEL